MTSPDEQDLQAEVQETAEAAQSWLKRATRIDLFTRQLGQIHKQGGSEYHTGEQFITALNTHIGVQNWSFRVIEHGYQEMSDEFWVLGELTAVIWEPDPNDGELIRTVVVKQQFGGQNVKRSKTNDSALSTGDDRKGAATDALKKCAMSLGFGLALTAKNPAGDLPYRRGEDDALPAPLQQPGRAASEQARPAAQAPRRTAPAARAEPTPPTQEQRDTYEFVRAEAVTAGCGLPIVKEASDAWTGPQMAGNTKILERWLAQRTVDAA